MRAGLFERAGAGTAWLIPPADGLGLAAARSGDGWVRRRLGPAAARSEGGSVQGRMLRAGASAGRLLPAVQNRYALGSSENVRPSRYLRTDIENG